MKMPWPPAPSGRLVPAGESAPASPSTAIDKPKPLCASGPPTGRIAPPS